MLCICGALVSVLLSIENCNNCIFNNIAATYIFLIVLCICFNQCVVMSIGKC